RFTTTHHATRTETIHDDRERASSRSVASPGTSTSGGGPRRRDAINSATPRVHAGRMSMIPSHDVLIPGEIVDERPCPMCGTTVQQIHRPGRARIYCTNSCRQRAYRWRRAHGVRHCVERNGPVERMLTYGS